MRRCGKESYWCCGERHDERTVKYYRGSSRYDLGIVKIVGLCQDQVSNALNYGWGTLELLDNLPCSKCSGVFPELLPNRPDGSLICHNCC
jgi:hypothetical protein